MPALYHHIFHSKRKTTEIMTSRRFQLDRALRKPPVQPHMCLQYATDFTIHDFPWLRESGDSRDTKRTMVHAVGGTEAKLANEARNAEGIVVMQVEEADSAGIMRRQSIRPTHPQPPTSSSETIVCTSEPGKKENDV